MQPKDIKPRTRVACVCRGCGDAFTVTASEYRKGRGQFCGQRCYQAWNIQHRRTLWRTFVCIQCGVFFERVLSDANRRPCDFCSRECFHAYREAGGIEARFWAKVDTSGDCWPWTGALDPKGYGRFGLPDGRTVFAHRFAWELTNGPMPGHLNACHSCDNPPCARPDHVFPGTQADNITDMAAKGRHLYGERNARAKLTEEQVREILGADFARRGTMAALARQFGVNEATIRDIRDRRNWRHITPHDQAIEGAT